MRAAFSCLFLCVPTPPNRWFLEASQENTLEMALLHHASVESEKANDEYRRSEAMRQEQLMKEGDVIASGDFKEVSRYVVIYILGEGTLSFIYVLMCMSFTCIYIHSLHCCTITMAAVP